MKDLDKTDRKILRLLQQNARIPMTELADKVGLSTTCDRTGAPPRARRHHRGYYARLNPHAGAGFAGVCRTQLQSKSGNIFEDFRREALLIHRLWNAT